MVECFRHQIKYKQDFLHSLITSLNDSVLYNNDTSYIVKVILYSYLILKKMNERITDS